jgi:hypothetical protein
MTYEFTRVTQVIPIYEFDEIFFSFLIEHVFFPRQFLPNTKKKKFLRKNHIIKLYKIHGYVHKFGWLT